MIESASSELIRDDTCMLLISRLYKGAEFISGRFRLSFTFHSFSLSIISLFFELFPFHGLT